MQDYIPKVLPEYVEVEPDVFQPYSDATVAGWRNEQRLATQQGKHQRAGVTQMNAEFAILLRSRLKGHGVGWLLMKHMIEFSRHKDLKTVRGQVLAENATMLAMCAELGFHIAVDPDHPSVKTVTLPVHPAHLTLR